MYKILCDGNPLYNPLFPEYVVCSPSLNLETSKVGSLSFSIYPTHKNYNAIKRMKSKIEVLENDSVIFRGRVFSDEANFYNVKKVEVEGVLAYFNDSTIRPYTFNGSVLEYITFLVNQHNAQVDEFQRFKLGVVTVEDENEYIVRENSTYPKTWEEIENKLVKLLGGYLCIRYEEDGNYIDYLKEFTLTNTQAIEFSKNLLDLSDKYDASNLYTAILPRGAEIENEDGTKSTVMITDLPDGEIGDDVFKSGDMLYLKSARDAYGLIYPSSSESTWADVTNATNLQTKAIAKLTGIGRLLTNTFQLNAVNLNYSDSQIASFRINRNVTIKSTPHNISETLPLTKLTIPLDSPQSTKITVGKTVLSLTDNVNGEYSDVANKITNVEKDIAENRTQISQTAEVMLEQYTKVVNTCNEIIFSALESYVETGDYETFKKETEAIFSVLSDQISMSFATTTEQISNVNGDLQSKFNQLYKHISFTGEDGIVISMGDGAMSLKLDNDIISFNKNGQQFGWWDGVDFHTGNIVVDVEERAQFGNIAIIVRSDESTSIIKVGG